MGERSRKGIQDCLDLGTWRKTNR